MKHISFWSMLISKNINTTKKNTVASMETGPEVNDEKT